MIGQTIAHYRITAKLGQGGMGAVYRATDTKLDREVAIKVLPELLVQDQERLARFDREAKTLAALNHPSIAGIYGLEQTGNSKALILELVEGENLSERLRRGPLPVEEALEICRQIVEALEAAHEKGIIHRDLKPGNVKLTADGKVKVLDFGLAKVLSDAPSTAQGRTALEDSPTVYTQGQATLPGVLLGTAGYMSPEQARGKPVDKRSDIWSFGVVLYECLTGGRLFSGETVTDSVGALLHKAIEWNQLPPGTPPIVQLLLRKCLARDRKRRLQDIGDARVDLEQAIADPSSSLISLGEGVLREASTVSRKRRLATGGLSLAMALTAVALGWFLKPAPQPRPAPAIHSELVLPGAELDFLNISPDARHLAFGIAGPDDPITLRHLDRSGFTEIGETKTAWLTFFSPDGRSVAYPSQNKIWRVALDGSKPVPIADHLGPPYRYTPGGSWSETREIVFPDGWGAGLVKVPSVGGSKAEALTRLKEGEGAHWWPQCLPGGTHVLFMVRMKDTPSGQAGGKAAIADLATGSHQILPLEDNCTYPRYAESGHLLYVKDGILFAVPFDLASMTISGSKKDVLQGIATRSDGLAYYDISTNGTLVYKAATFVQEEEKTYTLKWLQKDGTETDITTVNGKVGWRFALSPDEKYVALDIEGDGGQKDVWLMDLGGRFADVRFTDNEADDDWPFWSSDSRWIYFRSDRRDGQPGLFKKRLDLPDSSAEFVWENEGKQFWPGSLSREGNHLIYAEQDPTWDLWTIPLDQDAPTKRLLKGSTKAHEGWNAVSPDGKWLAYSSDTTGNVELYVAPFDNPDQSRPITRDGGSIVAWSSTGDRLFYKGLLPGDPIFYVDVTVENDAISTGDPQEFVRPKANSYWWQLDARGERVMVLVQEEEEGDDGETDGVGGDHNVLRVVSNFFTELNEKVPTAGAK